MDFGKLLQEKLGEHEPDQIEELILDNLFTEPNSLSQNQKINLEKYKALIHLSMNGIGIQSLQNMPKIESLQILELSNNKLTGNDLGEIATLYPNLYKLKLTQNEIASLDVLKSLKGSKIEKISLADNTCAKSANYRAEVFNMFPNVVSVDSETKDGEKVESTLYEEVDEGEEGQDNVDEDDDDEEFDEIEEGEDDEEFDEEDEDDEDEEEKPKKRKKN